MLRIAFGIFVGIIFPVIVRAQISAKTESPKIEYTQSLPELNNRALYATDLLIPAMGLSYGLASMHVGELSGFDRRIQSGLSNTNATQRIRIDDYMLYLPAIYGLGKSAFTETGKARKRVFGSFLFSKCLQYGTVYSAKRIIGRDRPDGSSNHSLPSGHTAEAFANAEFLRMYVGKEQPWVAVLGYLIAAGTGYLRIYNNRHWFSDVVAGAAIGYGSARLGSWSFDRVNLLLQQRKAASKQVLEASSF